jgi:predicted ATPase
MLASAGEAKRFHSFIDRIGKSSGLFEKIDLKYFGSQTDPTSPFEVDAYLHDRAISVGWLGYGLSQSLPVLVEILDRPKHSWFAIQQPEVHLHPRAQAGLGDAFFEMAALDNKRFLIETHSDFTIDRFRLNYRQKRGKGSFVPSSQVLFFERSGGKNRATSIPVDSDGNMSSNQPDSYRDFFIKEQVSLLS